MGAAPTEKKNGNAVTTHPMKAMVSEMSRGRFGFPVVAIASASFHRVVHLPASSPFTLDSKKLRAFGLRLWSRAIAVPDVLMKQPRSRVIPPDHDVFPGVHHLAVFPEEGVSPDLDGEMAIGGFGLDRLERGVREAEVEDALPERPDTDPTCDDVAVRGEELTVGCIEACDGPRVSSPNGVHELFVGCCDGGAIFGQCHFGSFLRGVAIPVG